MVLLASGCSSWRALSPPGRPVARRFRTSISAGTPCPKMASESPGAGRILTGMNTDSHALYKALVARDPRFDGVFFVGVTSTGIYCRPICPVKPPKEANCVFFKSAQEAEHAGFRPCLRCRPELAPGCAPVDRSGRIAHSIVQRIEEGTTEEKAALEAIAS